MEKNELLITELKHECKYFADILMKKHKGIMIQFDVFDPEEMYKDTIRENKWVQ